MSFDEYNAATKMIINDHYDVIWMLRPDAVGHGTVQFLVLH